MARRHSMVAGVSTAWHGTARHCTATHSTALYFSSQACAVMVDESFMCQHCAKQPQPSYGRRQGLHCTAYKGYKAAQGKGTQGCLGPLDALTKASGMSQTTTHEQTAVQTTPFLTTAQQWESVQHTGQVQGHKAQLCAPTIAGPGHLLMTLVYASSEAAPSPSCSKQPATPDRPAAHCAPSTGSRSNSVWPGCNLHSGVRTQSYSHACEGWGPGKGCVHAV